jgi:exosortase
VNSAAVVYYQLGVLALLSLSLYVSTLSGLARQWWHDPNFSYGFFVPVFSIYVLWQERERFAHFVPQPSWSGLAVIGVALLELIVGQMGAELFLARSSMVLLMGGVVVLYFGWSAWRAVLFPWAFLLLMIPLPMILLNQITFPLQLETSKVAAHVLPLFGVPIFREGNLIHLPSGIVLFVAEACSGLRSLMALTTLSIMYGFLMEKRVSVRILLAVASVPIAVAANSLRIIGTGLLVQYWSPEAAEGFFHASWGLIIFVVALCMLYALHFAISAVGKRVGAER